MCNSELCYIQGGDSMDAKKLRQFIAEIRKEKGVTQAELASMLHVTDKAVSKWERGLGLPDINSIEPLANALGISVAEVMKAERIPDDHVTQENASELLTNAFDMVKQQRRQERKHHILIFIGVLLPIVRPGGKFCVSVFRQNQEYHIINVHAEGLFPLVTTLPEGRGGMRVVYGVNADTAFRGSYFKGISQPYGRRT